MSWVYRVLVVVGPLLLLTLLSYVWKPAWGVEEAVAAIDSLLRGGIVPV